MVLQKCIKVNNVVEQELLKFSSDKCLLFFIMVGSQSVL
jgi:hypothetical protein